MSSSTFEPTNVEVPYFTLLKSIIRSILVMFTYDNIFVWDYTQGKRNRQADVEGPYYVLGAPSREIEKGKAVMAPLNIIKKFRPFLMTVRVVSPEGKSISGAELDWWQADTAGSYYHRTYTMRGRVKTDDNGYAEVLTVAPGAYGLGPAMRAAHFHLWIHAPAAQPGQTTYDDMITQTYVCDANDSQTINSDFVNYMRKTRLGNMIQCWSIPDKDVDEGRPYKNFPELSSSDVRTRERVKWWNSKLAQLVGQQPEWKIAAGGAIDLHLNPKGGKY